MKKTIIWVAAGLVCFLGASLGSVSIADNGSTSQERFLSAYETSGLEQSAHSGTIARQVPEKETTIVQEAAAPEPPSPGLITLLILLGLFGLLWFRRDDNSAAHESKENLAFRESSINQGVIYSIQPEAHLAGRPNRKVYP
jgi:hypothetical protein